MIVQRHNYHTWIRDFGYPETQLQRMEMVQNIGDVTTKMFAEYVPSLIGWLIAVLPP
jgi:hypothetical protein